MICLCIINRWKIDRALDEGKELDSYTQAQTKNCKSCHQHYQTQQNLISRLESPTQTYEAPAFLRSRVMNAISGTESKPVRSGFELPVWVPVAACLVLVFFLIPRSQQNPTLSPEPKLRTAAKGIPADFTTAPVELAKIDVGLALKQANQTISSPYDEELKKLQNDLRAAGKALKGLPLMYLASRQ